MQINSPLPRKYYIQHGRLSTLRNYPYQKGEKIQINFMVRETEVKQKAELVDGLIKIRKYRYGQKKKFDSHALVEGVIAEPTVATLKEHLKTSGFTSVEAWLKVARELNKGKFPKYLIMIERVKA